MNPNELIILINASIVDMNNGNLGLARQKLHIAIEKLCELPAGG